MRRVKGQKTKTMYTKENVIKPGQTEATDIKGDTRIRCLLKLRKKSIRDEHSTRFKVSDALVGELQPIDHFAVVDLHPEHVVLSAIDGLLGGSRGRGQLLFVLLVELSQLWKELHSK